MRSTRSASFAQPEQPWDIARKVDVSPVRWILASSSAHRRMNASALSRGACAGDELVDPGDTGGSAIDVSSPPQAASSSSGAVRAPAKARRTRIEAVPPETAVDVGFTVLTSCGLGEQVVERQWIDVAVMGEVDD